MEKYNSPIQNYMSRIQSNLNNTQYTKQYNTIDPPQRNSPQKIMNTIEFTFVKDFEVLKLHVKSLQKTNKGLLEELQKLRYEKEVNEHKFIEKINLQEAALLQFKKQKNYQIDLLQLKKQQQLNKLRRQTQKQMEIMIAQLNHKQAEINSKNKLLQEYQFKNQQLYSKNNELITALNFIENQIIYTRQNIIQINQKYNNMLTSENSLRIKIQNLQSEKLQIQNQVKILLEADVEKMNLIQRLEIELNNTRYNQQNLRQKLSNQNQNFIRLQQHINQFKQKLQIKQQQQIDLEKIFQKTNEELNLRDNLVQLLTESNQSLKIENSQCIRREKLREKEVMEVLLQNQKLYKELNLAKHKLHDIVVNYNIKF